MTPGINWQPDDEFLNRVKRAYRISLDGWRGAGRSMWTGISHLQRPVHDALMAENNEPIRSIFSNPGKSNLFYGVDNLCAEVAKTERVYSFPEFGSGDEVSRLINIGASTFSTGDDPFAAYDHALCQTVEFPNPFPNENGTNTPRGVASYRAVQALYQAILIRNNAKQGADIVEIGPGMGRTAYYASKAGYRYTTIDLPMGVVAQCCFLGSTLGPDRIWLLGDASDPKGRIRILPVSSGLPNEKFYLALNVDSMTEMSTSSAISYARWIAASSDLFLSINHNLNQFSIDSLFRNVITSETVYRKPYPLRDGYTEELHRPVGIRPIIQANMSMFAISLIRRLMRRMQTALSAVPSFRNAQSR